MYDQLYWNVENEEEEAGNGRKRFLKHQAAELTSQVKLVKSPRNSRVSLSDPSLLSGTQQKSKNLNVNT